MGSIRAKPGDQRLQPSTRLKLAGFIEIEGDSLKLKVRVNPRSSRVQWGKSPDGERLKLMVAAPPMEGKANKACVKFIAKQFGVAIRAVSVIQGEKSRNKIFLVRNYNPGKLREFLKSLSA